MLLTAIHTKPKSKDEGQDLKRRTNRPEGTGSLKRRAIGWSLRYEKSVERLNSYTVVVYESEKMWIDEKE